MVSSLMLLAAAAPLAESKALILRHCVRATDHDAEIQGYSATPLPQWQTPHGWCTERGEDLALQTGKVLVKDWGVDPKSVRVFADNKEMRTGHTAATLIRGMAAAQKAVLFDDVLFKTTKPAAGEPLCDAVDAAVVNAERLQRARDVPVPQDYREAVAEMQALIGEGPAGSLASLGDLDFDNVTGEPVGAVYKFKLLGQVLLYAYGSGMTWANATAEQAYRFGAWQHWFRSVKDFHSEAVTENARLMHDVLRTLEQGGNATDIFVGHDGNIDGITHLLGLSDGWDIPPFVSNGSCATPPNSGLWIERDPRGAVELSYLYVPFELAQAASVDDFALKQTAMKRWESLAELKSFVQERLKLFAGAEECFARAVMSQAVREMLV